MYRYIGIRGHRGAGKQTISYLLGVAIEHYLNNGTFNDFSSTYQKAVDRIKTGDEYFCETADFTHVYFDAFSDIPKIMLAQLIGIDSEWMYDDNAKDMVFINMKDFSNYRCKSKLDLDKFTKTRYIKTTRELSEICYKDYSIFNEDTWISLRELIMYFSKYTMQRMFGKNVWVKSLDVNSFEQEQFFAGKKTIYKIFTDTKFVSEVSYIKKNEGYIVNVIRPDNVKDESEISQELKEDNRIDFEIIVDDDLTNLQSEIESITLKILNK